MLKVQIFKDGVETNAALFNTENEINDWYEFNKDYFPEGHTKVVVSLVELRLEELRTKESEEAMDLGFKIMVEIRKINRRKLKLGLWDQNKFNSLLGSTAAANIERALWNGSLSTAAYLLTNMSDFYSDIEIAKIVDLINKHETKWASLI